MNFGFSKHRNSIFLAFPNIGIANFRYSKHWNSIFLAFPNIGIVNFDFSKYWNCEFSLFQTLELYIFGFSKHWNCEFWRFETLELRILAFPNTGIANFGNLNFGFIEQKNSRFLPFLTFFYPKRGLALQLENFSGQGSLYKNGVCTV